MFIIKIQEAFPQNLCITEYLFLISITFELSTGMLHWCKCIMRTTRWHKGFTKCTVILVYNFWAKDSSLTLVSTPSLLNATSVNLINRLPPALYPSTNNYANKNQWSKNRKSLARQLKPTMAHGRFQKGAMDCNKEGDNSHGAGKW